MIHLQHIARRAARTSGRPFSCSATAFRPAPMSRPAPPALPRAQQEELEALIRKANAPTASSTAASAEQPEKVSSTASNKQEESFHPAYRKVRVEFEGEVNPKTGEVGGPKRDPFGASEGKDWQYGGRVTDF